MRNIFLLLSIILIILFVSCSDKSSSPQDENTGMILSESIAKDAFSRINDIRENPDAYSNELGVDLSGVEPRENLNWNNTLKKVAQDKALDMARNNYFSHTTKDGYGINYLINKAGYKLADYLLTEDSQNNFESLFMYSGTSEIDNTVGIRAVNALIIDANTPSLGHRKHLLGIGDFWSDCYDCGIGISKILDGNLYKYYVCVIIAKQE